MSCHRNCTRRADESIRNEPAERSRGGFASASPHLRRVVGLANGWMACCVHSMELDGAGEGVNECLRLSERRHRMETMP
jgi:hypothetical protein